MGRIKKTVTRAEGPGGLSWVMGWAGRAVVRQTPPYLLKYSGTSRLVNIATKYGKRELCRMLNKAIICRIIAIGALNYIRDTCHGLREQVETVHWYQLGLGGPVID